MIPPLGAEAVAARREAILRAVYGMEGSFDKAELREAVVWRGGGPERGLDSHVNLVVNELHEKGELDVVSSRQGRKGFRYRIAPDTDDREPGRVVLEDDDEDDPGEPHSCTTCWVPPNHALIGSLGRLYGKEFSRSEVQVFASTFCPQR